MAAKIKLRVRGLFIQIGKIFLKNPMFVQVNVCCF